MKFLFLLATLLMVAKGMDEEFVAKIMEELQSVTVKCADKEGATTDDLVELAQYKYPLSTHEAKCTLACFYEHYKMLKEDGTFDKKAAIKAFEPLKAHDEAIYNKMLQVVDICYEKQQIYDDRCETAAGMAICVKKQLEEVDILKYF